MLFWSYLLNEKATYYYNNQVYRYRLERALNTGNHTRTDKLDKLFDCFSFMHVHQLNQANPGQFNTNRLTISVFPQTLLYAQIVLKRTYRLCSRSLLYTTGYQ